MESKDIKPNLRIKISNINIENYGTLNDIIKKYYENIRLINLEVNNRDKPIYTNIEIEIKPEIERTLYNLIIDYVEEQRTQPIKFKIQHLKSEQFCDLLKTINKYKTETSMPVYIGNTLIEGSNAIQRNIYTPAERTIDIPGQIFKDVNVVIEKEASKETYKELTDIIYNIITT